MLVSTDFYVFLFGKNLLLPATEFFCTSIFVINLHKTVRVTVDGQRCSKALQGQEKTIIIISACAYCKIEMRCFKHEFGFRDYQLLILGKRILREMWNKNYKTIIKNRIPELSYVSTFVILL